MKFLPLLSLFFFLGPYSLFAQIDANLAEALVRQPNKNQPVSIEFIQGLNLDSLQQAFTHKRLNPPQRTQILNRLLLQQAQNSQAQALEIIQQHAVNPQGYRSFYIYNAIVGNFSPALIQALADVPTVRRIAWSKGTLLPAAPLPATASKFKKSNAGNTEPGLRAINAPAMWTRGYTGRGRSVYIFDSGIWDEHPTFSQRYLGLRRPQNAAWFGLFAAEPSGAQSSHGTHVLGTVAGLEKATADTIGVAFNSYWMANDLINASTAAALPPQAFLIAGFEWALNPDGDTNTLNDIPDVINNSWRWRDVIDTVECGGFVPHLMNVIEAAGIANVFSGGNTGPNNNGLNSPQRINSNVVNTFCVGSIDGNQSFPYPISNFSTRGPSQCPGSGPLSIHPEVVAPGQNVRSAWGANGYNTISGTSMASPHVSGALLLLKEAFPQLSGKELMEALYYSAVDMGSPGEDNVYGRGLIDVEAAFLFLSQSHTPVDPTAVANDLALEDIVQVPSGPFTCDTTFTPLLVLENKGSQAISAFNLSVYRNDVLVHQQNLVSSKLQGLNTRDTLPLDTHLLIPQGKHEYTFAIATGLSEYDSINNQYRIRLERLPQKSSPLSETFETTPFSWQAINPDGGTGWDTTTQTGYPTNQKAIVLNFADYLPRENQYDDLYSPNVTLPAGNGAYHLAFDRAYQARGPISQLQDTLQVLVTSNCGASFSVLYQKEGVNLSTLANNGRTFIPQSVTDWDRDTLNLSAYQGQTIQVVFRGINRNGNNLYLDNISIYQGAWDPLAREENQESLPLKLFPNPANDRINLESFNATLNLQIINAQGQKVWQGPLQQGEKKSLACDQWPAGLYFLQYQPQGKPAQAVPFVVQHP
jgi:bacillopeptidase F